LRNEFRRIQIQIQTYEATDTDTFEPAHEVTNCLLMLATQSGDLEAASNPHYPPHSPNHFPASNLFCQIFLCFK